jgi:hypothetical protein
VSDDWIDTCSTATGPCSPDIPLPSTTQECR